MTDRTVARPTIYAVATGTPDGPVAIVRVSGPRAAEVARLFRRGTMPEPRRLARRILDLAAAGDEEALVVWMPGPASFTGEDVVELHVHGGAANVAAVLARLGSLEGFEPAQPGEFTRRAFEHGRIDLARAEGIAAVIGARTEAELAAARRLAAGVFGGRIDELVGRLRSLAAEVEGSLDFPDDVPQAEVEAWAGAAGEVADAIGSLLRAAEAQRSWALRPRVVLAGPPNAGKSSLFNALVGRRRVVVSDEPGTTRDAVEVPVRLAGREVLLVDTAGIRRDPASEVEAAGIAYGTEQVAGAACVVWVEAADAPAADVPDAVRRKGPLYVENKRDLGCRRPEWLGVSALAGTGLAQLEAAVAARLDAGAAGDGPLVLPRHAACLEEARARIGEGVAALGDGLWEVCAWQVRRAAAALGRILGRGEAGAVGEDVLEAVFSGFCIGK